MTDLAVHIQNTPLADTHEHLLKEDRYVNAGPDVLEDLFAKNYIVADLVVAGASPEAAERLRDSTDPDIAARWDGVKDAWEHCRHTGYGEAVMLTARHVYGMDEITVSSLEAARTRNVQLRKPGERLRILKEVGNLDHVQVDDQVWECLPDASGPEFFMYDLSWRSFSSGMVDVEAIYQQVGVEVSNIASLREAMATIFERWGACAIAVKSQHAYDRTLFCNEPSDSDAERVLMRLLAGEQLTPGDRICLGDWCLARGVEFAIQANLPFKIHTGYYCRINRLRTERIRPGHLCSLLIRYPEARFVLMHAGYPYTAEMVAIAKHFPNVYVDMSWVWSIDPLAASAFVRHIIHAVPTNRLFVFGGDTLWPSAAVGYAIQARHWLTKALQAEIDDGYLSEPEAMNLASRFMQRNQAGCFDMSGTRTAIRAAMAQNQRNI